MTQNELMEQLKSSILSDKQISAIQNIVTSSTRTSKSRHSKIHAVDGHVELCITKFSGYRSDTKVYNLQEKNTGAVNKVKNTTSSFDGYTHYTTYCFRPFLYL